MAMVAVVTALSLLFSSGLTSRLSSQGFVAANSESNKALDVLAREVKILGIFSDWPATVTYYANCMGMK